MSDNNIISNDQMIISIHFAVIDKELVWYGKMNLLGKEKMDDSMMRVQSKKIAAELMELTFGEKQDSPMSDHYPFHGLSDGNTTVAAAIAKERISETLLIWQGHRMFISNIKCVKYYFRHAF